MDKPEQIKKHIRKIKKKLEQLPENPSHSLKKSEKEYINGQPGLTIEIEKEFDVLEKTWESKVFVKLFVAARTSGLLQKISDREFKTLIALALYMDENGDCYPSQNQIAKDLGCSRITANRRIQSLLKFRFNGKPIIQAVRVRNKKGEWDNIRYTILPVAQVKIFEKPSKKEIEFHHVSKTIHGPCDDIATWQNRYTNKNHILNKNHINNVNNARKKSKKRTEKEEFLAQDLAEKLEDEQSLGFYRRVVELIPEHTIYQALSEVKDTYLSGRVRKNRAALFNSVIQSKAKELKIDLGLKTQRR
jgi:hypothetical protein